MTAIQVRDLRKRYGDTVALTGIDFEVADGEVFGLLGPNGAGKTTTVEILEGLRTPDSGTVRVLGLDPVDERLRQRTGVQLQEAQLPERMRVGEALELYAGFYDRPRPVGELLEQWGLTEHRRAQFRTLSGGQKQRLFLALALVGSPELVFFDELSTGLDPRARRRTWDRVRALREQGTTVLLVSHLMDEVQQLCDRVAVLDRGRVVALDRPAVLAERYGDLEEAFLALTGRALSGGTDDEEKEEVWA